jgi:hypothetical protein
MAITIGLTKEELYDTFLMFSSYDGNLLNTFNYYLECYTIKNRKKT